MRKWISCFLTLVLLISLSLPALAAESEAQEAAQTLYEMGLFQGTGTDAAGKPAFDLERAPSRAEAVTMLVRLLGKEREALAGDWNTPFTDVADWAKPYVGYAYANGLTAGVSQTRFGGENSVTAAQFLTFALRALGYESGKDFSWDSAWTLSDDIGLSEGRYDANAKRFTRGDAAIVSLAALRKRPCRFTAEYTPYDGALIFRDICSGTARQDIIQTVQAVCREHGKEPDVYLKEETDE